MAEQDGDLTVEMRIVTNAQEMAQDMGRAMDSVGKAGAKAAKTIETEFSKVKPERGFIDTGRAIIKMADQMGVSLEKAVEVIKEQNRGLEKTSEQLLFAARAAKDFEESIKRIGIDQLAEKNVAGTILQNAGITPGTVDPEAYAQQLAAMQERLALIGAESESVGELTERVMALNEEYSVQVGVSQMAADIIKELADIYTKMGMEMPTAEANAFAEAMNKILLDLEQQKIGAEDAAKALGELRQQYVGVAQARAQGAQGEQGEQAQGQGGKGLGELLGGGITQIAGGVVAGFGVVKLYGEINKLVKESIGLARQSEVRQVSLAIAVRDHQRAVGELSPSIAEAKRWTEELSEQYLITENEAEGLITQTLLLTRDLNLTAEETKNLAEGAQVLAQTFGRDTTSTLRTLTEALNSGRTEGLDAYGISVDSLSLKTEAVKRGLMSAGDELDSYTKKQVIATLIEERVTELREDSAAALGTQTAELAKSAEAAQEAREEFGRLISEADLFKQITIDKATVGGLMAINVAILWLSKSLLQGVAAATLFGATLGKFAAESGKGGIAGFAEAMKKLFSPEGQKELQDNWKRTMDMVDEEYNKRMSDMLRPEGLGDIVSPGLDTKAVEDAFAEIKIITEDNMKQLTDRTAELWQEYQDAMSEIQAEFAKRRAELEADYRQEVADEEANYQRRKAEAQVEFNRREKREAEDHKIDMRRLEEDYLMELDDLVRERDAKGVLMAQRRYNVEKRRKEEDYGLGKNRREQDFQYEQKQMEYQRALRLQMMKREYEERQAKLARQEQEALMKANEAYTKQLELERKAAEESLRTILEAAKARMSLSQQELKALYDMLKASLPAFTSLWSRIYGAGASTTLGHEQSGTGPLQGGYARGGTFFATGPTTASFGEGGPERVDVTPLSASTGQGRPGFGGGNGNGKMQIELSVKADPMLMVEIAEKTMSDVADVVVRLTKTDSGGLR